MTEQPDLYTDEQAQADDYLAAEAAEAYDDEYCNRPRSVECAACHRTENAPEQYLRKHGWKLGNYELCPAIDPTHLTYILARAESLLQDVTLSEEAAKLDCPF